jgi:hypothetical protein
VLLLAAAAAATFFFEKKQKKKKKRETEKKGEACQRAFLMSNVFFLSLSLSVVSEAACALAAKPMSPGDCLRVPDMDRVLGTAGVRALYQA